ncbi:hypothetical protein I316_06301 [Kwoniella heveanensis BCC8398]|uniref:Uncharacterized protein n=1 Tax=Kwoniella heveanensis BCC8398 TaxID=1296120 RepID=A0A1B9GMR3_9TREE|nr:hypothetical protein I316_06301 [Kwoniella heveanensis BCC8398]
MSGKTVLITGTNRGVGAELAKQYISKGYTVISAVRATEKQANLSPPGSSDSRHLIVKLDVASGESIKLAFEHIKDRLKIDRLDVVINNAAIGVTKENAFLVKDADPAKYSETFDVNLLGTLNLFTAAYPFLPKDGTGKFIALSTLAAVNSMEHWPLAGAYALSKNAVNYLTRQIHFEEKNLITFTVSPGWVDTDMGHEGAEAFGAVEGPPEKVAVTAPQIVNVIENGTREREGGRMINYDGTIFDW